MWPGESYSRVAPSNRMVYGVQEENAGRMESNCRLYRSTSEVCIKEAPFPGRMRGERRRYLPLNHLLN